MRGFSISSTDIRDTLYTNLASVCLYEKKCTQQPKLIIDIHMHNGLMYTLCFSKINYTYSFLKSIINDFSKINDTDSFLSELA